MFIRWYRQNASPKSQASSTRRPTKSRRQRRCRPQLEALEQRITPQTYTWTGHDAPPDTWSRSNNWDEGRTPGGDLQAFLAFPPFTNIYRSYDDYGGVIPIESILYDGPSYTINGDPGSGVSISGEIIVRTPSINELNLNVAFRHEPNEHMSHNFDIANGGMLTVTGNITGPPDDLNKLEKKGGGTLVLNGHNSYGGRTNIWAGTVQLGWSDALPGAQGSGVWMSGGALLDLNNRNVTIRDIRGLADSEIIMGYGTLTLRPLTGFEGVFRGTINGSGGLVLDGQLDNSFQALQGFNTYTGPTDIRRGTLLVDGSLSALSDVTVQPGARLRGSGTVGSLTVLGTLAPGGGIDPYEIFHAGITRFAAGSSFHVRLDGTLGGREYEILEAGGTVSIAPGTALDVSLGFAPRDSDTFTIIHSTGGITGTFAGLPENAVFGIGGKQFRINYTSNSVVLTHLPQFILPPAYYPANYTANSVAVGAFNGFGIPDLAVGSFLNPPTVNILTGKGDGTFQPPSPIAVTGFPIALAVGHFHNPNILDLAVATYDGHVDVLLGNGDGTFQDAVAYTVGPGHPFSLVVGDLNGDGNQDLVLASYEGDIVSILYGNPDGTFQDAVNLEFRLPAAVALADLNGDHKLDLVVGYWNPSLGGVVSVLTNLGNDEAGHAIFRHTTDDDYPTRAQILSLAVADLGNGRLDVITATGGALPYGLSVLLGNGDGTFQRDVKFSYVGDFLGALVVADFDGDGKADVAVAANNSARGVAVLYGKGDGTFQTPVFYDLGGKHATAVAAVDFNHDGGPDLAVTVYEGSVAVLINREGRGGPPSPPPGSSAPRPPAVHSVLGAVLLVLAGDRISGTGSTRLPVGSTPTRLLPSPGAVPLALEVRQVDRLFAVVSQEDRRSAVPRLRAQALTALDDRLAWETEREGWLAEENLPARPAS